MTAAEKAAAARTLTAGPRLAARNTALAACVPPSDEGLVTQVPLQIHALALAARATACLLAIVKENAVVAAEGTPAVLACASGGTGAAPHKPPELAEPSQGARSRDQGWQ
jgi:hypothetical protein